jgi:ketosteroid isomerase-like protein
MIRGSAVVSLALAVLAAGCAQPPKHDVAADKAQLAATDSTWFATFAAGDSVGLANLYAEDAVIQPPNEPAVSGRAAIRSSMGQMMAGALGAKMKLKSSAITGSGADGDMGWISGVYAIEDSTGATVESGKYLSVHQRVKGAWLYVRDTWNSDAPQAPPPQPAAKTKKK